ncbi:XdhC family protein [Vibrio alginolyticus]|nr:XdhC family protein [Vibrio alginolyticus]
MTNSLRDILTQWNASRDNCEWVLCTIYQITGSSYRKPGAMMMISGRGLRLGLLSGGCLEADIQLHAKRVMSDQRSLTLTYDATDEDDLTFQLGIGCGGVVHILLQPVSKENAYLGLKELFNALEAHQQGLYYQCINPEDGEAQGYFELTEGEKKWSLNRRADLLEKDGYRWLRTHINPEPHLLIAGAGSDAVPVYQMAKQLGWNVSLWDPRPANARREYFQHADFILRDSAKRLAEFCHTQRVSSVILMAHSVDLDSQVLKALALLPLNYLGMLGPAHRRAEVFETSGITKADIKAPVFGPVGLNIGGETPESIALSILSEIHASLCGRDGRSLSEWGVR